MTSVQTDAASFVFQKHSPSDALRIEQTDKFQPHTQPLVDESDLRPRRIDREAARAARYLNAEKALTDMLRHSMERQLSTRDLQIVALQQATNLLNAHIVDAKGRVEKLRSLFASHEVEPDDYRSMQHQRWMEERRQSAAEELSTTLGKHLATLASQPMPRFSAEMTTVSNAKPNATLNLEQFFDLSRRRVQVRNRPRRRIVPLPLPRQEKKHDLPHVHHHRHLLSLKLKPLGPRLAFLKAQSTTWSGTLTVPTNLDAAPPAPPLLVTTPAVLLPFPLASAAEAPEDSVSSSLSDTGTATIWYSSPRTNEEILSDLVVSIPDYVSDLLAGLDRTMPLQPPAQPTPPPLVPIAGPPPTLRKSPSRRRLSNILTLPEALSSRITSSSGSEARTHALSKRFSTPPPSSFSLRMGALGPASRDSIISEECGDAAPLVGISHAAAQHLTHSGRISFSASHLPDLMRPAREREQDGEGDGDGEGGISTSTSHGSIAGGNMKIVKRLRNRISMLRGKVGGGSV